MRKAAFHNLGCKVNSYETEAMQQLLEDAGYEIVPGRSGCLYYQHVFRDECCRPEIAPDAAPGKENEPVGGCCGGRLLCAGSRRGAEKR